MKVKARAMRKGARFPEQLWPYIIGAAVYLLNRTPRQSFRWVSPLEELHGRLRSKELRPKWKKPNQAHLRVYGCKAFTITKQA